ncbi:GyrI-like domain-containing protein [Pseudonocardia yunnanensis]|uniref:GyrI-like domain-containing protein n=1 Tax=Pseudonocardia yunnanensis TaxID=58107 RepID=A0ABW4F8U4_9PSEU
METNAIQTPHITERAEQQYAYVTRTVTMDTFSEVVDRIPVVIGWLAERGLAPAGAPFLRYRVIDMERRFVVDAGVPVADPVTGDEVVQADVLPAGRYATVTHRGHPDQLIEVTASLLAWADEHGHRWDMTPAADGDHWGGRLETFHTHPAEVAIDDWVTELAFRLAE